MFTVNLAFKDVRLGIEMCESFGQRVPMMSRAREVFAAPPGGGGGAGGPSPMSQHTHF